MIISVKSDNPTKQIILTADNKLTFTIKRNHHSMCCCQPKKPTQNTHFFSKTKFLLLCIILKLRFFRQNKY